MTRKQAALAVQEEQSLAIQDVTFDLPALVNPEEVREIIAENLEGLGQMKFDKIGLPSGGGISFTLIDESGEENPVKEINGVILDKSPFKAWYIRSFDEKTEEDIGVPDCFSSDGIRGSGCVEANIPEGQLCEKCPKGQWASDRKGGPGKDCTDKIRIHILMEGDVFPKIIDLPPSSIKNFNKYVVRLTNKLKSLYSVVTTLKLEKDKSGSGIPYSRVTFAKATDLSKEEQKAIKQYIKTLKPAMSQLSRESIAEDMVIDTDATEIEIDADEIFAPIENPWA
jgi:hypothetical protein